MVKQAGFDAIAVTGESDQEVMIEIDGDQEEIRIVDAPETEFSLFEAEKLIDRWKAENKCEQFIDYNAVEKYKDFGGIRLEDDILVTKSAYRELGKHIPRTIEEVEQASS